MSSVHGHPGARLASRLRGLREREWPDLTVTQMQLATALSAEKQVGSAAVSTWENVVNPKTPPVERLSAYARFFATRRSMDGGTSRLLAKDEFDDDERERFESLEQELFQLHASQDEVAGDRRLLLSFEHAGPVVIVCPEAPTESRGPLADSSDPNYTRLHRFADADALIEVFGHIRALNPERQVLRRLPSDTRNSDLQNHLVMLGGIGWNLTLRRVQMMLRDRLPVEQFEDPDLPTGEVFRIRDSSAEPFVPTVEEFNGVRQLTEDVGLIARLRNPFNTTRTLTICNGVHSTGVLGAVLAVTDETVRPTNETYLAERFPRGEFAMLVKVPVIDGDALAPDFMDPDVRLFEWSPTPAEG